jgi:hypothetical protein
MFLTQSGLSTCRYYQETVSLHGRRLSYSFWTGSRNLRKGLALVLLSCTRDHGNDDRVRTCVERGRSIWLLLVGNFRATNGFQCLRYSSAWWVTLKRHHGSVYSQKHSIWAWASNNPFRPEAGLISLASPAITQITAAVNTHVPRMMQWYTPKKPPPAYGTESYEWTRTSANPLPRPDTGP